MFSFDFKAEIVVQSGAGNVLKQADGHVGDSSTSLQLHSVTLNN